MENINEIEVVPKSITIGCKLIQVSVIIMAIKYAVISINLGKSFKELLMAMSISVASLVFVAIIAIYISKRKYILSYYGKGRKQYHSRIRRRIYCRSGFCL